MVDSGEFCADWVGGLFVGGRRGVPFWLGSGSGDGLGSPGATLSGPGLLITSTKPAGCSRTAPMGCEATLFGCLGLVWFGGSTGNGCAFRGVEVVLGGASWGGEGCFCAVILGSPVSPVDRGVDLAGAADRVGVKMVGQEDVGACFLLLGLSVAFCAVLRCGGSNTDLVSLALARIGACDKAALFASIFAASRFEIILPLPYGFFDRPGIILSGFVCDSGGSVSLGSDPSLFESDPLG